MRVLQINAIYKNGSTGRMISEIHKYMKSIDLDSFVACAIGEGDDNHFYLIGSTLDRKLHSFMARLTGLQAYYSQLATKKLIGYIDMIKPDVVHLHNIHSNYLNMIGLLEYLAEKKITTCITLHDCWFFTGKCTHYTMSGCNKWKSGCGDCPKLNQDIPSWLFDRTSKMLNDKSDLFKKIQKLGVIGVSEWITNEAKASILQNATIIKRVYNWIDPGVFHPKEDFHLRQSLGMQGKFVILGVASDWNNSKGIEDFINIANWLDENEIIILVGDVQGIELPKNIFSVGIVQDVNKLADYYSMADVFLQLSQEESFGKVVAESLACGTPAIVYDATASGELVDDSCGYKIKPGNIDGIFEALKKVRENTKKSYTNNCIRFATASFDMKTNIEQYLSIYRDLVKDEM